MEGCMRKRDFVHWMLFKHFYWHYLLVIWRCVLTFCYAWRCWLALPGEDRPGIHAGVAAASGRRRPRKEKVRFNGVCGYYICYSIFVGFVGLTLLAVLLTIHLVKCVTVVSDMSVYDCFVGLQLGRGTGRRRRRRPFTHWLTFMHTCHRVISRRNAVPIVKMFKNALWTALRAVFRIKCTKLQGFAYIISKFFPVVVPRTSASAPGARTQTPIFTCLASVPIVPDLGLRNDHRS